MGASDLAERATMSTPGTKSSGHLIAIGLALGLLAFWSGCPENDRVGDVVPLMEQGRFEEALEELELIQSRSKGGSEAVQLEAICHLALDEQPKAVRTLQKGIEAYPTEHELSVVLADIYLSLGQAVRKCRYSRCDRLRFFLKCR